MVIAKYIGYWPQPRPALEGPGWES